MAQKATNGPSAGRNTNRIQSFKYAFEGIFHVVRTQENAWIHALLTVLAIILGLMLKITLLEWAILSLAAGSVWASEAVNTAVEAVVDLASPEYHELAKIGKDAAAGAVLFSAIFSAIVGVLILGPPLFERIWPVIQGLLGS